MGRKERYFVRIILQYGKCKERYEMKASFYNLSTHSKNIDDMLNFRDRRQILFLILTHFQPMFHLYRGYRSGALVENGLSKFKRTN